MSLINKMLQDLDQRRSPQAAAGDPALAAHLKPVATPRYGSEVFWRVMAAVMLLMVGWVAWVMWQLTPHPVVTDLAYQSALRARPIQPEAARQERSGGIAAAGPAAAGEPAAASFIPPGTSPAPATTPPASPAPAVAAATSPTPASPSAASPSAAVPAPALPAAASATLQPDAGPAAQVATAAPRIDMLKLATELFTPIPERKTRPPAKPASAAPAPVSADAGTAQRLSVAPAPAAGAKGERAAGGTPRQLADAQFRRASRLVNEGKSAEGMDGLRAALSIDPSHELVRQSIVALQIEGRQVDAAAAALREGLALNPSNPVFAVLLARIMVERNDIGGALALLQKHGAGGNSNAEYRAFVAALQQRLGRHQEAIDEYQAALRMAPATGTWWVGLGISQEASSRPREAVDAFRRARASGNLTPDLITFVDERLKQLQ